MEVRFDYFEGREELSLSLQLLNTMDYFRRSEIAHPKRPVTGVAGGS